MFMSFAFPFWSMSCVPVLFRPPFVSRSADKLPELQSWGDGWKVAE
jgi:hypothetical protein